MAFASLAKGPSLARHSATVRTGYGEALRYNREHRHGGIGLLTPHDVHYGLAHQRVAARARVLAAAHAVHPERFPAGVPTPLPPPNAVWINPPTQTPIDAEETH